MLQHVEENNDTYRYGSWHSKTFIGLPSMCVCIRQGASSSSTRPTIGGFVVSGRYAQTILSHWGCFLRPRTHTHISIKHDLTKHKHCVSARIAYNVFNWRHCRRSVLKHSVCVSLNHVWLKCVYVCEAEENNPSGLELFEHSGRKQQTRLS